MRLRPSSSIVERMLRSVLLGAALVFFLVTSVTLFANYRASVADYRERAENVIRLTREPLSRALWNFDTVQLQSEIDAIVLVPIVIKAEVLDEQGQVVARAAKAANSHAIDATVTRPIEHSEHAGSIGALRLYLSDGPVRDDFLRSSIWVVAGELAMISTLAALLFYLLHRNIIAPLLALADGVDNLDPSNATQQLHLPRAPHRADEIDRLIDAINRFHREIIAEREVRQQVETQSRSLSNELTRMGRVATVQSLTTTIAHELNQPLGAILSNAETIELSMLDSLPADAPLREVLTDIVSEARRAGSIIRNMRDLTENRDSETTALALNPLVQQVADLARLDARWDSIRIELQLAESLPAVIGNAVQLQQVILNLVANARDALRNAGVSDGVIAIKTRQDDELWLSVIVSDSGPGIPPDKIDYILKPFFTTKEGGTGMGLWISQMIVEQHGGKLDFGNAAAGGAWFSIKLPVLLQP